MFSPKSVLLENSTSHPAISPADIAQLMAKKLAEGFTPNQPHRARVMESDVGFVPSDFRATSLISTGETADDLAATASSLPKQDGNSAEAMADRVPAKPAVEPARDFEAELRAAYERGLSEGLTQGAENARAQDKTDADIEVKRARDLFLAAAKNMAEPPETAVSELAQTMLSAINRLTSERVGLAINDHPEAFLLKVQQLADRVAQGVRQVKIHLNSTDLDLVEKHFCDFEDQPPQFVASNKLGRGEIEIRGDGIKFQDLFHASSEEQT